MSCPDCSYGLIRVATAFCKALESKCEVPPDCLSVMLVYSPFVKNCGIPTTDLWSVNQSFVGCVVRVERVVFCDQVIPLQVR